VVGTVLAVATVVPALRRQEWWVRMFDFPRLQIGAGLLAVLLVHVATVAPTRGALAFRAMLALCFVQQARRMLPYTRLVRRQVQDCRHADPRHAIRLVFANVLQSNRNAQALLEIVQQADADVVLVLETDAWWLHGLDPLAATHPHVVRQPQDNTYGMALYSRLPLIDPQVSFLVEEDVPSIHTRVRLGTGHTIALHCLHPRPPAPQESDTSAERDAELLVMGKAIRRDPGPVIVMGDMNDVAWSHTSRLFRSISGLLDPRIGRGFFNTFDATSRWIRYPLDHFFHSNDFRVVSFRRLQRFGSDHFPVFIHLSHEPQAEHEQPEPQADSADHEEADEKIAQAPPREAPPAPRG
jgi:endonuclease/exonuclease/phosphatase (EEP) superfamily protein YafD